MEHSVGHALLLRSGCCRGSARAPTLDLVLAGARGRAASPSSSRTRVSASRARSRRDAEVDREHARVAVEVRRREDRVGEARLLAHALEQPRAHAAAEQGVEHDQRIALGLAVRRRRAFRATGRAAADRCAHVVLDRGTERRRRGRRAAARRRRAARRSPPTSSTSASCSSRAGRGDHQMTRDDSGCGSSSGAPPNRCARASRRCRGSAARGRARPTPAPPAAR